MEKELLTAVSFFAGAAFGAAIAIIASYMGIKIAQMQVFQESNRVHLSLLEEQAPRRVYDDDED